MTFGAGRGAAAVLRSVSAAVTLGFVVAMRAMFDDGWWYVLPTGVYGAVFWYCGSFARSIHGTVTDTRICVRYGVLWRRETVVPIRALRTFETFVPPLHRLFRCRTVVLRFAGGSVWLPLLCEQTAQQLTAQWEGT